MGFDDPHPVFFTCGTAEGRSYCFSMMTANASTEHEAAQEAQNIPDASEVAAGTPSVA